MRQSAGWAPAGQLLISCAACRHPHVLSTPSVRCPHASVMHPLMQLEPSPQAYKWWQEQELRDLCDSVGLVDFRRARSNRFILFSVAKPENAAAH